MHFFPFPPLCPFTNRQQKTAETEEGTVQIQEGERRRQQCTGTQLGPSGPLPTPRATCAPSSLSDR